MKEVRPSFVWRMTSKCNYKCPYCRQGMRDGNKKSGRHCSDELADAVLKLAEGLPGTWLIKLIGGEPLIYPRFFEVCEKLVSSGHELCTTTNFSLLYDEFQRLIDICGEKLTFLTASLHPSQVKSVDEFVDKAAAFRSKKSASTSFTVTSVLVEEDFENLRAIEQRLTERGVKFKYQVLKTGEKYFKYKAEIEEQVKEKLCTNTEAIRGKNFFGTLCPTGELFFNIRINGDVFRCYNDQICYYLGNISRGTFKRFTKAMPCMARRCTCTAAANRNMICYGQNASKEDIVKTYAYYVPKNLSYRGRRFVTKFRKKIRV
jgi:MoaA/NifB/PqqE/SkfB family radical SAM enzyme